MSAPPDLELLMSEVESQFLKRLPEVEEILKGMRVVVTTFDQARRRIHSNEMTSKERAHLSRQLQDILETLNSDS